MLPVIGVHFSSSFISFSETQASSTITLILFRFLTTTSILASNSSSSGIKTLGLELWKQNEKQIYLIAYLIWKAIEKSEKTTIYLFYITPILREVAIHQKVCHFTLLPRVVGFPKPLWWVELGSFFFNGHHPTQLLPSSCTKTLLQGSTPI